MRKIAGNQLRGKKTLFNVKREKLGKKMIKTNKQIKMILYLKKTQQSAQSAWCAVCSLCFYMTGP